MGFLTRNLGKTLGIRASYKCQLLVEETKKKTEIVHDVATVGSMPSVSKFPRKLILLLLHACSKEKEDLYFVLFFVFLNLQRN